MTEVTIDKRLLRRAFASVASRYDEAAVLQREVGARLVERLEYIHFQPEQILEVGSGTGYCTQLLHRKFPAARIHSLDIAEPMLCHARSKQGIWHRLKRRNQYIVADAEALPLQDACMDMIFSNLTLQWVNNLEQTLREFARVLRPGGMLLFSTFGPDTLHELHQAWHEVDEYSHVNRFVDLHDIGDAMLRVRLAEPVMDAEHFTLTYPDVFGLMRDLKAIGAHNVTSARARGLMGKGRLHKLVHAYEQFRRDGVLPATYEVVYGHAWGTPGKAQHATLTEIPLSSISKAPKP